MNKLFSTLIAFASVFTLNAQFGFEKPAEDWYHKDLEKDGIPGISVDRAYEELLQGTESTTIIVAVIDGGVDPNHEDLKSVMWVNEDEIAGNGIDDDNNGYIDDIYGWNFIGGSDGNVDRDNLEVTRIYRDLKEKYSGKLESEIPKKDKAEFEYYKKVKKDFEKRVSDAKEEFKIVDNLYNFKEMAEMTIEETLGKSEYTVEEVMAIEAEDELMESIKEFIVYTLENDFEAEMKEMEEYYGSNLNYNYNLDFDPRNIVGDNYSDKREKYYGNNEVGALVPSHGTHVAGIIAADRTNGIGMKGIADDVKIMALRVVPDGDERDKDIANAIYYAVDNGAKIINMSFGKSYSPEKYLVDEAMKYAEKNDVLLVHAAGNSGRKIKPDNNFPNQFYGSKSKKCKTWVEIGAQGWDGMSNLPANFSNYGSKTVDIFSPGVDIYSTIPGDDYAYFNGTSMAAPAFSGVAALVWSRYPDLSAKKLKKILLASGTDYSDESVSKPGNGEDIKFGELSMTGKSVNAYNALKMLAK